MGWWAAAAQVARDALGLPRPPTFDAPVAHTFDTAPQPVDRVIQAMRLNTGPVGRTDALSVASVQRGRNELCAIATLPLRLYRNTEIIPNSLLRQFDMDVPNVVHMSRTVEDLAFDGVAWWRVTGQDFEGYPVAVRRVDPSLVRTVNPRTGKPSAGYVWIERDGQEAEQVSTRLMIRFDSPNPAILAVNARAIRRAIALDQVAAMYAANPNLREYFTDRIDPDIDPLDDDGIDAFLAEYGAMRNVRPYGWIPRNVERTDVSSPSPRDLTLAELQKQVTLEVANGLGVDAEDLGVSTTSRTYMNDVDRKQDKINRVYGPYMRAITDRLSMGDVTRYGNDVRFDLTDYLKSDPNTQADYWKKLIDMGVVTPEWVAGQANVPITAMPAAPTPAPALPVTPSLNALPAARTFSARATHQFDVGDFEEAPDDAADQTVDVAARTITGLAVPYGVVARKWGQAYAFEPGSLEYSDPARMPHLMDHGTPVGFHSDIQDTPAGPMVTLTVLSGPEGSPERMRRDQLLYDAQHGLYTGLSVGVDFSENPDDGDVNIVDGVIRVKRATWRETSTTPMPVFDDARVTTVAASRTQGESMDPCQHCGQRHAANIACATFAAQVTPPAPAGTAPLTVANVADAVTAALALRGPTEVNPLGQNAQVTEPAPYLFDRHGNIMRGSHDFSTDVFAGWKQGGGGDQAARDRAEAALEQQFAVTPANVVALNYPQNRPEMYVDQLDYRYPLYEAAYSGPLDAVTPFVVPKFSSASGLVADHVTGTEPTPGAFAATAQTITPSAMSGKVEVTREAYDQGGNPQMSGLIWRQMTRAWYEGLEAFVQAQMIANAASIADLTITTAAADAILDQAITDALVPLQYIRGGDVFDTVFTQIDLYKAMVKAKDSAGRRLYPQLGAQNAVGTVSRGYTAIDAHGKIWLPAWALAASGTVAASSWMFDREVVNLWVSAPRKIDLEWRVAWVDVGIWGYKAFAITDFTRTRELVYDPV